MLVSLTFFFMTHKIFIQFGILDLVIQTKLASSKSEVRRMIKNNGLKLIMKF